MLNFPTCESSPLVMNIEIKDLFIYPAIQKMISNEPSQYFIYCIAMYTMWYVTTQLPVPVHMGLPDYYNTFRPKSTDIPFNLG